jgi:hypothetical protein
MFHTLCCLSIRVLPSCYPGLSVYIVSWNWIFKAIVHESHKHQPTQVVWIFHQIVPNLVLRIVSITCQVHRAFKAFDESGRDLAQFIELRLFPRCDQFLVPWPRDIEPWLA